MNHLCKCGCGALIIDPTPRRGRGPAEQPQLPEDRDWEHRRVVLALWARGKTLRAVAKDLGCSEPYLSRALRVPHYPRAERAIARALGLRPEEIWPTRWARRAAAGAHRPNPVPARFAPVNYAGGAR